MRTIAEILARDAEQRAGQESTLQTYQVIGKETGAFWTDGTPARDWYILFQYPDVVKKVYVAHRALVWENIA